MPAIHFGCLLCEGDAHSLREVQTMTDPSDAALRERARNDLTERYMESAGRGYFPPPKGTRWGEWLLAMEAFIPTVAASYIALRDAARAEQQLLIAQVNDIANDCEEVANVDLVGDAERRTWLSIATRLRATAIRAQRDGG